MTPERERILDKIKKCMAMAKSGNEHEAAAALRQARSLMESNGISDAEMLAICVSEQRSRAGAVETPARWETLLAGRIASVFGCRLLFVREDWYTASWSFIGVAPSTDVAQYSFDVLLRQVKKARSEHIKSNLKRYKKANKSRLADLFCEGWVQTALALVAPLSSSLATREALDAYMQVHHPKTGRLSDRDRNLGRQLSGREYDSLAAGKNAGKSAELHQGVAADARPLAIESRG